MTADCDTLTAEALLDIGGGRLPAGESRRGEEHLRACPACRLRHDELMAVEDVVIDRKAGWGRYEPPPEEVDDVVRSGMPVWAEATRRRPLRRPGARRRIHRFVAGAAGLAVATLAGIFVLRVGLAPETGEPRVLPLRLTDTIEIGGEEPGVDDSTAAPVAATDAAAAPESGGTAAPATPVGEAAPIALDAPASATAEIPAVAGTTTGPEAVAAPPAVVETPKPVEPPLPIPAEPAPATAVAAPAPDPGSRTPQPATLGPGAPPDAPVVRTPPPAAPPADAVAPAPATPAPKQRRLLRGDVNGDGRVDIADALLLSRGLAQPELKIDLSNGDANGDGRIDEKDVLWIQSRQVLFK